MFTWEIYSFYAWDGYKEVKMKCMRCGKEVKKVCANCWRCDKCKLDCKNHMKRLINGLIEEAKNN